MLHGDPAKPNVDIFFKVPGRSNIAAHKHTCVSAEPCVLFIAFEKPLDAIPLKMVAAKAAEAKTPSSGTKNKGGGC